MSDQDQDQDRQHSSEVHPNGNDEGTNKRKSDDGSSACTRTKRNRYISLAWCRPSQDASLPCNMLTRVVTNARGERSNATARIRVSVVAGCLYSVYMCPIVAPVASRTRSKHH